MSSSARKAQAKPKRKSRIYAPNSLIEDFRALWLVRSRVIRGNLAFLLVIMGYDPRSREINNRIYLVYALAFFALWIFMVLTLLADFGARLLAGLPLGSPAQAALVLGVLAFAALFLVDLFSAARRSPFSFNDVDAQVICMTPVDRRVVALEWLGEQWLVRGAGVWPASIVLGYALLQAQSPRELTPADLPAYLLAGLRMFAVAAPLYLGTLGLAWSAGAWRLRGAREQANLRLIAPLLAVLLLAGVALFGWLGAAQGMLPLSVPLRSGLGLAPVALGLITALVLAIAGPALLWWAARGMSLSRAAQETRDREAIQAAALLGRADVTDELSQKQRLGVGCKPTRLPGLPGRPALIWKALIQAGRRLNAGQIFSWLGIFISLLVLLLFPGAGTRGWSVVLLVMLAVRLLIAPLRRELARWWLVRQLPHTSESLAALPLLLPVIGMWLVGAAALFAAQALGPVLAAGELGGLLADPLPGGTLALGAWLYFASVPAVGLAGALDVLRQCKTGNLLAGSVADLSLLGMLLALLAVAVNGGAAYLLLAVWGVQVLPGLVIIASVNFGVLQALWSEAGNQMRRIQ